MKSILLPSPVTPGILVLMLLAALIVYAGVTGLDFLILSNIKLDIILFLMLGSAICSQGGIGRIAATGQWLHPQSLFGYLLGALILITTASVFVGIKLPLIQDERQALLAIVLLASLKVINAVVHFWMVRG